MLEPLQVCASMQRFDISLKALIVGSAELFLSHMSAEQPARWIDIQLLNMESRQVDLLGETPSGELIQIEFQSSNDTEMLRRMAEYSWAIYRREGRFPRQTVVYIGKEPMKINFEIEGPDQWFRYGLVDMRDLDGDELIEKGGTGDSILAVLARLRDNRAAVRKIVERIAALDPQPREEALRILTVLSGLRKLENVVTEEIARMPLIIDIMQNEILGPEFRRGLEQGIEEGREEGRREGELAILTRLLEKRFGPLPVWAQQSLAARSAGQLEELTLAMDDAASLKDLLK